MVKQKKKKKAVAKKNEGKKSKEPGLDLTQVKQCPECGGTNIFLSKIRAEIICRDCGSIFSRLSPKREAKFRKASEII